MQSLVDSYECEWKAVVNDPEKRRFFQQFANTDLAEPGVEFVTERGQQRPADWPADFVPLDQLGAVAAPLPPWRTTEAGRPTGCGSGRVSDFPIEGGRAVKYGRSQIAVFRFASRDEWYACENLCPHKREMVLARGILGDQQGTPESRLPAAQEDVFTRIGGVLERRGFPGPGLPGQGRGRRRLPLAAPRKRTSKPSIRVEDIACATHCAVPLRLIRSFPRLISGALD